VTSQPDGIRCGHLCEAGFEQGASVRLTATAGGASEFTGWSGAGCAGTGPCVVTLDWARSVQARFDPLAANTHVLTVSVAGKGGGSVASTPAGIRCGSACRFAFEQGQQVTLTAAPDAGSDFVGWRGAGCADTRTCVVTVDQALTVTALFEPATPVLKVIFTGGGTGIVLMEPPGMECAKTCESTFGQGQMVRLVADANGVSVFTGWKGAGCTGTDPCDVTMDGAKDVEASFVAINDGAKVALP